MTITNLERETAIRARLCDLLADITDQPIEPAELLDDTLLAYDLGLESIEVVALLELVEQELGVCFTGFVDGSGSEKLGELLDRLSVRWVIDRAMNSCSSPHADDDRQYGVAIPVE